MIRACITFLAIALMLLVLGTPVLLIGLVYPAPALMTWGSAFWARVILATAGVRVAIEGTEHLSSGSPRFFVGNHQSALDIPIVLAVLRGRVRFMAKESLFRIPLFGWVISRYAHVPIDRTHPRATLKTIQGMIGKLARIPISLVVFPEGTRSPDGELLPFRKGALKICQRAGLSVVPFSIDGSRTVHRRGRFHLRPGPVRVTFAEPIPAGEVQAMTATELHDRVRGAILRGLGQRPSGMIADEAGLPSGERA